MNRVIYNVTVRRQNGATYVRELPTSPETAAREKDKGHLMQAGESPETVSLFYNHVYDVNNICS